MMNRRQVLGASAVAAGVLGAGDAVAGKSAARGPGYRWRASAPLLAALDRDGEHFHSVKDPTVVRDGGRWHIFATVRGVKRSHQIEYLSVADWNRTGKVERTILNLADGYHCAPQVFYFRPHKRWYMICQARDATQPVTLQPAFSTTQDIGDPASWSKLEKLFPQHPASVERWIDFWVICDDRAAHLFFTSNNGKMWRAETPLDRFPHGWDKPRLVLEGDIFEASHTYRLKGRSEYLTMIEAEGPQVDGVRRRYFKGYVAEDLRAPWKPVAATVDHPFAGIANVKFTGQKWADSISHGELLRASNDETLTVDPGHLQLLFQGATDEDMRSVDGYGKIPWRLGLLTAV